MITVSLRVPARALLAALAACAALPVVPAHAAATPAPSAPPAATATATATPAPPAAPTATATPAPAQAAPRTETTTVDGVTVTISSPYLPSAAIEAPKPGALPQLAGATDGHPFRLVSIEAIPYGHSSDAEGVVRAAPGDAPSILARIAAGRRAAHGVTLGSPDATLFGATVQGMLTRTTDQTGPHSERTSDVAEWTAEAGSRIWIVREAVETPAGATTSPVAGATLTLSAADVTAPTTEGRGSGAAAAATMSPAVASLPGPTIPYPSWWGGGACNSSQYSGAYQLASWGSFPVCAPGDGASFTASVPQVASFPGFQCVELSMRWMYQAYGVPSYYANGNQVFGNYSGSVMSKIWNNTQGTQGPVPQPGDVLSLGEYEAWGHTAVVYQTNVDANGNGSISTIEENAASTGTGYYTVTQWHVDSPRVIIGWLHSPRVVTGDGSFVRTPDQRIYRLAGGAPIGVTDCVPLGGCTIITDVPDLSQFRTTPADGTLLLSVETGNGYSVAGGAPLKLAGWSGIGSPGQAIGVNQASLVALDHLNAVPADGTFVVAVETGHAYRFAGGAPIMLTSWAPFSNPSYTFVNQGTITTLDHMHALPADATFIVGAETGNAYRIAGGAPIRLTSWAPFTNPTYTSLNQASIDMLDHMTATPVNGTLIAGVESGQSYRVAGGAPLMLSNVAAADPTGVAVGVNQGSIDMLDHLSAVPADGTFIANESASVWRVAGGAPLQLTSWAPFGAVQRYVTVNQTTITSLDHLRAVPADGTFITAGETASVYRVAGGAPLHILSWGPLGGLQPSVMVNTGTIAALDHLRAVPGDGEYVSAADSGNVYRVAGGAPMRITTWAPLGGVQATVAVDQATIDTLDHLRAVPADGTFISTPDNGQNYRIAGGAPIQLTSWAPWGSVQPSVAVDAATVTSLDHLSATPLNGTTLVAAETGTPYRVAGGAPLRLVGITQSTLPSASVTVNLGSITELSHLSALPVDGTFISAQETGQVYRIAGGAPLYIDNWAPLGGVHPTVAVPAATIAALDHMNAMPTDGTFIQAAETGAVYRVAGGAPLWISSWIPFAGAQPTVVVNSGTISAADHMRQRPADGTYLVGGETGKVYRVTGGAPLRIPSWSPMGGPQASVMVTQSTIDSADHMLQTPAPGTFLIAGDTQTIYRVAGGAALWVNDCSVLSGCAGMETVEQATITAGEHLNAVPADGTVLVGEPSGGAWSMQYGRRRAGGSGGVQVNDHAVQLFLTAPDIYIADSNSTVRTAWTPAVTSPSLPAGMVRGVGATHGGGWVLDLSGGLHPFGTAPQVAVTGYWPGRDLARGVAVRPDGRSGYVLDAYGGIHPFGGAPQLAATSYWPGWDIARGIALDPDGLGGYVLDGWGGIHPFGNAPAVTASALWTGWDIAKGITVDGSGHGGYVVDGFGGVHAFGGAPARTASAYWNGWNIARGIASLPGAPGAGWVVDGFGGLHPYGGAPAIPATGYSSGRDLVRGIAAA